MCSCVVTTAEATNRGLVCAHPSVPVFVILLYKYLFSLFLSQTFQVLSLAKTMFIDRLLDLVAHQACVCTCVSV